MPMSDTDDLLKQLRESLKEELRAEVRAEIIAELSGGARPQAAPAPGAPKAKPGPKPKAAASTLKVKAGQRRSPEDLGKAKLQIWNWFRANPSSRIDQLSKAIGVPVKDLQLPVQLLLNENGRGKAGLSKTGELRGTRYTARSTFTHKKNR